jgi:DNA-binding transcriptional LysR family regulator
MSRLANIEAFVKCAELGTFTRAARRLGLSPSALSRRVSRLEQEIGVRLFHRTTRAVRLSDEGRAFFERARAALREIDDAEQVAIGRRARPSGSLRVEAPSILGRSVVLPAVAKIAARHSELNVELTLRDFPGDLVADGIDVAVRLGPLTDSALVVRPLGHTRMRVCGAPAYLRKRGAPHDVAGLARHECLGFALQGRVLTWRLREGGVVHEVLPGRRIVVNSADALIDLAVAGVGLAWVCDFMMVQAGRQGELVEVLAHTACDESAISVLSPPGRTTLPKVDVFVQAVKAQLAETFTPTHRRPAPPSPGPRRGRA